jgi:hypothetical protein
MADMLATTADLTALLQRDPLTVDPSSATLAIEICTAVVQAAADGQRIVLVAGDSETIYGADGRTLKPKQKPIISVTSVTYDGDLLTQGTASGNWRMARGGLWRDCGWNGSSCTREPAPATVVVYSHGYADGAQELQLGRGAALSLARGLFVNADGVVREQIDDYAVAYDLAAAALDAKPSLKALIRKQYGPKAAMVRVM